MRWSQPYSTSYYRSPAMTVGSGTVLSSKTQLFQIDRTTISSRSKDRTPMQALLYTESLSRGACFGRNPVSDISETRYCLRLLNFYDPAVIHLLAACECAAVYSVHVVFEILGLMTKFVFWGMRCTPVYNSRVDACSGTRASPLQAKERLSIHGTHGSAESYTCRCVNT